MKKDMKVLFVTHNKYKFREAKEMILELELEMEMEDMEYPEIQGDLEEIVIFGIKFLKSSIKNSFIIEDAGLFIDALNGFPGPYSAYVQQTVGNEGIIKIMNRIEDRKAFFRAVLGFFDLEKDRMNIFEGYCRGKISHKIRGNCGFGYDPIFIPDGVEKTFGEMEMVEKNKYSHRGNALRKFRDHLRKY